MTRNQLSLCEDQRLTLEDSLDLTCQSLLAYGLEYRHWAIAYSGGKDSSATKVEPMVAALKALRDQRGEKFLMLTGVRVGESAARDSLLARKQQRLVVTGGQLRLRDVLASWLDTITARRGLKPTTQADYQYKLELWGDLADYTLSELEARPDLVDTAETALITAGTAETTVRQARSLLSRALDDACRKRFLAFNLATPERRARLHQHAPNRLSAASAYRLCQTA